MCGSHNRLTVVDIDSPSDAELQHALETYGNSPIIVQTPSGGRHVYYSHTSRAVYGSTSATRSTC